MMNELHIELDRLLDIEKKYNELLYAVGNKYQDETRHETALRYITKMENESSSESSECKPNKNVKAPKFVWSTEGYDPDKLKNL